MLGILQEFEKCGTRENKKTRQINCRVLIFGSGARI